MPNTNTNEQVLHDERLVSNVTTALFAALTLIFGGLSFWRLTAVRYDWLAAVLQFLSVFFLFYTVNYRTLRIRLTHNDLTLSFGVFRWRIPLNKIAACRPDNPPALMRFGGAGIHFMMVDKRYRASFNFLEYPRVVLSFKHRIGPVRDLSFTTRQPDKLIRLIRQQIDEAPGDYS